jgi:hypothetical protein
MTKEVRDVSVPEHDKKGPQVVSLAREEGVKQLFVCAVFGLRE